MISLAHSRSLLISHYAKINAELSVCLDYKSYSVGRQQFFDHTETFKLELTCGELLLETIFILYRQI